MEAYLVQHGEANSDEEKALSEKGRKDAERVAAALARAGVGPAYIMHSNKLRAKQTAEIFAAALKPHGGAREMLGLAPTDNPKMAKEFLESAKEPVMLVGHLPHLARLSSLLLTGNADEETIKFKMAGVVCLVREERWKIKWVLTPELA
jgi:phosphohistidine phosphatase